MNEKIVKCRKCGIGFVDYFNNIDEVKKHGIKLFDEVVESYLSERNK
jgi:hypothetical protein